MAEQRIWTSAEFMQIPREDLPNAVEGLRAVLLGKTPGSTRSWNGLLEEHPRAFERLRGMEENLRPLERMLMMSLSRVTEYVAGEMIMDIIYSRRDDLYLLHTQFPEIELWIQ